MSQNTATTTTCLLMVACSDASSVNAMVMMASLGPNSSFGSTRHHFATTADAKGHKRCCWPCHCAVAVTSVPDAFSHICQLCHGSSTGKFLFQSWPPTDLPIFDGVYYGVCFLLSGSNVDAIFTQGGSTIGIGTTAALQTCPW